MIGDVDSSSCMTRKLVVFSLLVRQSFSSAGVERYWS